MKIDIARARSIDELIPSVRYLPPEGSSTWPPVHQWTDDLWRHWLRQHAWTDETITQYLDHDRYAYGFGLFRDGTLAGADDAQNVDVTWLYRPSPVGVQLHACGVPNILFGGEAGGTKSYTARWHVLKHAWSREHFRGIIVRRELEELLRSHWDKFEREVRLIGQAVGDPKAIRLTSRPALLAFEHNGAKIVGAHAHNNGDEEKYLTEDYDIFFGDESTQLLPKQVVGVAGRVRNDTKLNIPGQMILSTNPGGPSHDWHVRHFRTKQVSLIENPKYDPADYTFIRAQLHDNPFYVDSDGTFTSYEKRLAAHAPARRRQLMNGDWDSVVGQFFDGFHAARHVHRLSIPERCHVEIWIRSGVGGKTPYACWVACLPDGRIHLLAELLGEQLVMAHFAQAIVRATTDTILPATTGRLVRVIGDAAMFPTSDVHGESPSETCRRAGLYVIKGDDQESFGWERVKHWWGVMPITHDPWLTIDPDCVFAIRTLPTLVQDDTLPDLVSEEAETQAAHALRVGVMARPSPSPIPISAQPAPAHSIAGAVQDARDGRKGRPFGMVA